MTVTGEESDLAVERATGHRAERPGRTTETIDDASMFDGNRGVKAPPSSRRMSETSSLMTSTSPRLLVNREGHGTDLICRAHVYAIDLAMRWNRGEMYHPGVTTTGTGTFASARMSDESPPMPPLSPDGIRHASRISDSVRSRAFSRGRP